MNKDENENSDLDLALEIGSRIRLLRRQRHISQTELALRIGMRPGPLNTLEKGRHVPSGRVLFALSRALEVSVADLFPPGVAVSENRFVYDSSVGCNESSVMTTPFLSPLDTGTLNVRGEQMVSSLAASFLALEDLSGAMKCALIPLYIPFVANNSGIELLAGQVRHNMGVTNAVVFDYLELLENSGLRVIRCNLPKEVSSISGYDQKNGNAFFFINTKLTVERSLFRLIFEFGRIFWHTRNLFKSGNESDFMTDEYGEKHMARKFAAFFLMPAAAVCTTVGQIGIRRSQWTYDLLMRVKHRFGVSAEAFAIRLQELDLIEEDLANDLKAQIHEFYHETNYKEPSGSMRRLMHNGRLGDLFTAVTLNSPEDEELQEIKSTFEKYKIRL